MANGGREPDREPTSMEEKGSARLAVITIVCILVLFAAGATALLWPQFHQKPQTSLTQRVEATVADRQLIPKTGMPGRDYDIRYRYTVDGITFEASARSNDDELSGDRIPVCIDPSRPERNAPVIGDARCGDESLGKWTSTAKRIG